MNKLIDTDITTGPLELLVLQGTSFCNLNCRYCYLSFESRQQHNILSDETLILLCDKIINASLLREKLDILWHSGEPLTLPISYYSKAFKIIEGKFENLCKVNHVIQTNGILLNDDWCKFIQNHSIRIGVSLDGPAFINDLNRRTKSNRGTFDLVLKGVKKLNEYKIKFGVLAVLTYEALDHPDEIYKFFKDIGASSLGFSIDEIDGVNTSSTFQDQDKRKIIEFYTRLIDIQTKDLSPLLIRELEDARIRFMNFENPVNHTIERTIQTKPLSILTCDTKGNYSTFSPELINMTSAIYPDFCFGNIQTDNLEDIGRNIKFNEVYREIKDGIERCRISCQYFGLCKGGTPSNKFGETGSFAISETMNCRMTYQAPIDALIAGLKSRLNCQLSS